jgi:hypothetical protein
MMRVDLFAHLPIRARDGYIGSGVKTLTHRGAIATAALAKCISEFCRAQFAYG